MTNIYIKEIRNSSERERDKILTLKKKLINMSKIQINHGAFLIVFYFYFDFDREKKMKK